MESSPCMPVAEEVIVDDLGGDEYSDIDDLQEELLPNNEDEVLSSATNAPLFVKNAVGQPFAEEVNKILIDFYFNSKMHGWGKEHEERV